MTERNPDQCEQEYVRHRYAHERDNLAERQRHGKPQIIQFVQPLLDTPDIRVRGQVHEQVLLPQRLGQWTPSALVMPWASARMIPGV
jgi:hypothetical protein